MKKITIKVGSSFFIDDNGVNFEHVNMLTSEIKRLQENGIQVCLVSSGAIAVGLKKLALAKKPKETAKKQALAAIGQMSLMQIYEQSFEKLGLKCAQILVSHDDFGNRDRMTNLKRMTDELFLFNVIPVVNENDAVATAEIKVGDNDTLSAMMALVTESELLILVSDVDGLYTSNPFKDANAKLISRVEKIDEKIIGIASAPSTEYGTGGMITKITAGRISTTAGIPMAIINQTAIHKIVNVTNGESVGTFFEACQNPLPLKMCWLRFLSNTHGSIEVDDGAKNALLKRKSLLSCGVKNVVGNFEAGQTVLVVDKFGNQLAKGIVALPSQTIKNFVESDQSQLVIHANNLVLI